MVSGWKKIDPLKLAIDDATALRAIDDTTAAAAIYAKQNHGWKNITGTAEGSIRMERAKKISPERFRGLFGSFDVNYFIFLELGHFAASERGFQFTGGRPESAFARMVHGDHTLRRAADAEFPKIGRRLRGAK